MIEALKYVGEAFINKARNLRTYKDRTGNLRSSIGYLIALDGKQLEINLMASGEAKQMAEETFRETLIRYNKGFVLIGVAGMQYAASLESRGYDVITGSSIQAEKILRNLMAKLSIHED
jgi:hypothetical protein